MIIDGNISYPTDILVQLECYPDICKDFKWKLCKPVLKCLGG